MSVSMDDLVASLNANHIGQEAIDLTALQVHTINLIPPQMLICPRRGAAIFRRSSRRRYLRLKFRPLVHRPAHTTRMEMRARLGVTPHTYNIAPHLLRVHLLHLSHGLQVICL